MVTHLESYKAYWFCVSAIGTAGEGLQCDPAMGRAAGAPRTDPTASLCKRPGSSAGAFAFWVMA